MTDDPFRWLARRKANRKDPYSYEAARLVVVLRLLGFDVRAIARITGVLQQDVRVILKEHGRMPRRSDGNFYWKLWYVVPGWRRKFLTIPDYIPRRAETASGGVSKAVLVALGVEYGYEVELPPVPNAPDRGYHTVWMAEARRVRPGTK